MKILFSDYDGTFKEEKNLSSMEKNTDAVRRFMDNGNLFAFATGRSFGSIKSETTKHNIPYNYLVCNNGSAVFDSNDNLMFHKSIQREALVKTLAYLDSFSTIKSIELKNMYGETSTNYDDVVEVICTLRIKNIGDVRKIKDELSFLQTISFLSIVLLKEEIDKKDGIELIARHLEIPDNDIYTIGDETNDIGMLREYNGYKMLYSNPALYFKGIKTTTSVRSLIRKLERN